MTQTERPPAAWATAGGQQNIVERTEHDRARVARDRRWTAFLAGYGSGFRAGLDAGRVEGAVALAADLKAAGAALRASTLWDPSCPSHAERERRRRARYVSSRDGDRTGPELVAAARRSWGLA